MDWKKTFFTIVAFLLLLGLVQSAKLLIVGQDEEIWGTEVFCGLRVRKNLK